MRRRLLIFFAFIGMLIVAMGVVLALIAPDSSPVALFQRSSEGSACLQNDAGVCYAIPQVEGLTIDDDPIAFPDAFNQSRYTFVVTPFDEAQQVEISGWLPLFSELAGEYDGIGFYSIAPLPDSIAPVFRAAIVLGISISVSDPDIRPLIVVMFLEDQAGFLEAIGAVDDSVAQVLIVDDMGTIFYRDTGGFTDEKGTAFREAFANLVED